MKSRLIFWPVVMAYACFLIAGKGTYGPVPVFGAFMGSLLGLACAFVFFRRARRYQERELSRLLTRY
jgi:uncharacterized membrane protein YccC